MTDEQLHESIKMDKQLHVAIKIMNNYIIQTYEKNTRLIQKLMNYHMNN